MAWFPSFLLSPLVWPAATFAAKDDGYKPILLTMAGVLASYRSLSQLRGISEISKSLFYNKALFL